jgi:hypothetical protein
MLAESLRRVDIHPQSIFLNVDDASTSVTKGLEEELPLCQIMLLQMQEAKFREF